jgi:hypothetical protein
MQKAAPQKTDIPFKRALSWDQLANSVGKL